MNERLRTVLLATACMLFAPAASTPAETGDAPHPDCGVCHSGTAVGPDGRSALPDASVCLACHSDLVREAQPFLQASHGSGSRGSAHVGIDPRMAERVPPGGTEALHALDCLSCHAPHANGQPHQLRVADDVQSAGRVPDSVDAVSRSCLRCHGAFLQTARQGADYTLHPIGVPAPVMRRRPDGPVLPLADVLGTREPEDDVVACTTCHFVHGSPNPDLLRWSQEEFVAACTTCHGSGKARAPSPDLVASDRLPR